MTTTLEVEQKVEQLLRQAASALENKTETGYQRLQTQIYDLEALAREVSQAKLNDLCRPILSKLENDTPLSAQERETVKLLLIGEAEHYLAHEDDLDVWQDELARLFQEINKLQTAGLNDVDTLMRLRAFCREAMRVVPDLAYYFREQERVRKFETASREPLTPEARRVLADLIRAMMTSDKV